MTKNGSQRTAHFTTKTPDRERVACSIWYAKMNHRGIGISPKQHADQQPLICI